MLRSLFAGVSGLRAHEQMMDVVGNNIANVNTAGFKSSTVTFQDLLSQVLQGATAGTVVQGGSNPAQIGLGTRIAAVTTNFTQGALQNTGKSTDVALQGDGFFVMNSNGAQVYTRAGTFDFDSRGNFVNPASGELVQGWMTNQATGVTDTTGAPGNITLPPGQLANPIKTNNVVLGQMLSSDAPVGAIAQTTSVTYDTQGNSDELKYVFTKTAVNTWQLETFDHDTTSLGKATLVFDPGTGALKTQTPATYTVSPHPAANWTSPVTVSFGTGTSKALKEFAGQSTVSMVSQDGVPTGTLTSFKIGTDGSITGVFSNGTTKTVAQVAVANFNNPSGLEKAGGSDYRMTPNSGTPAIGTAGTGGRGSIASGTLEMSNVDLSQEFTNLIIAQRGFQANSKVITTSDEILQTLLDIKR